MLYVDLFIVNVALPAIGRDFHASVAMASWTVTGYVLMIGVLPLGVGRLGDIWGHRAVYLVGLALFLIASFACGLAPTIGVLIACRVLQGIGAAIMTPATLAIVTRAFPPQERGLALGIYGGISSLGLVAGPLLGGLLVNGGSWRWVFFINVPIGIIAIVMTYRFVSPSHGDAHAPRVDWLGLCLLAFGLLGLLLALTHGALDRWTLIFVGGGCALLALFGVVERRIRAPLMDMALLRNRAFVGAALSFLLFSAALFGSQPYTSLFLQNTWGMSPLQGGLAFLPAVGLIAMLTPLSGILGQRAGKHVSSVAAVGAGIMGVAFVGLTFMLTPHSTYATSFLPIFLLRGLGIPVFTTCAQLAMLAAVPPGQVGLASGTLGMARNVGTAVGVTLLGGVYVHSLQAALPAAVPGAVRAQADQFQVGASAVAHVGTASAIVQGFLALNVAAALCCGLAVVALLMMRNEGKIAR
jgi:MFS transporter, DHA2 family, methylenomycin A resistance protein